MGAMHLFEFINNISMSQIQDQNNSEETLDYGISHSKTHYHSNHDKKSHHRYSNERYKGHSRHHNHYPEDLNDDRPRKRLFSIIRRL